MPNKVVSVTTLGNIHYRLKADMVTPVVTAQPEDYRLRVARGKRTYPR